MRQWIDIIIEGPATGRFLFHASDARNENSIRQKGLVPTNKNQWGGDYQSRRVYFTQDNDDAYLISREMFIRNPSLEAIVVFKFDIRKLNLILEIDPEWDGTGSNSMLPAVYTEQNVPASAIIGNSIIYRREDCKSWLDSSFDDD